ncbi:VanW family protein [Heyndrickxia sporothermodurans]
MNNVTLRPIRRTHIRITIGKLFYTLKRYFEWNFDKKTYANEKKDTLLQYIIFKHQSILFRKLQGVDMWYQENKIKNLKIAVQQLNGIIIKPGETFSYWKLIGKPSKRKGYVEGMVLFYGKYKKGIGGGLCQLSNLIYWSTLHTPLIITERYRHSYDVFPDSNRTQPFGSGATCAFNYFDLQITNNTKDDFQLHLYLTDTHLVGEWRCTSPQLHSYYVYEKNHFITPAYWGGYIRHNSIYRKVFNNSQKLIDDEFITENHAIMMYEPLIEMSKEPN